MAVWSIEKKPSAWTIENSFVTVKTEVNQAKITVGFLTGGKGDPGESFDTTELDGLVSGVDFVTWYEIAKIN